MTSTEPKPRRIEWSGPESWVVWADEDGVHLRAPGGACLEMSDVARLFSLWSAACAAVDADRIVAPKPPTREEIREEGHWRREEHAKRRAIRAVESEFNPPTTAPF